MRAILFKKTVKFVNQRVLFLVNSCRSFYVSRVTDPSITHGVVKNSEVHDIKICLEVYSLPEMSSAAFPFDGPMPSLIPANEKSTSTTESVNSAAVTPAASPAPAINSTPVPALEVNTMPHGRPPTVQLPVTNSAPSVNSVNTAPVVPPVYVIQNQNAAVSSHLHTSGQFWLMNGNQLVNLVNGTLALVQAVQQNPGPLHPPEDRGQNFYPNPSGIANAEQLQAANRSHNGHLVNTPVAALMHPNSIVSHQIPHTNPPRSAEVNGSQTNSIAGAIPPANYAPANPSVVPMANDGHPVNHAYNNIAGYRAPVSYVPAVPIANYAARPTPQANYTPVNHPEMPIANGSPPVNRTNNTVGPIAQGNITPVNSPPVPMTNGDRPVNPSEGTGAPPPKLLFTKVRTLSMKRNKVYELIRLPPNFRFPIVVSAFIYRHCT